MFSLKKFLAPLFSPLSVCLELAAFGLLLLVFSRKQKTGKVCVALSMVVLLISSFEGISGRILGTLETQYPPLNVAEVIPQAIVGTTEPAVKWIVVLAGGVVGDSTLPIQLQISHHSRVRLMEGIRLHRLLPGSKIILTGGIGFEGPADATTLSRVAQELGVAKSDMLLEVESRDTKDHPLYVRDLVKQEMFILVTSAFHMPRAMKLFAKQGLFPIPAPAGHWKPAKEFWSPANLFPSSAGIRLAELAYHEYMGLTWAWVRGQI
jgi:uncharacterized SAM-binding protein YcdF (DUF218 family)